MSLEEKVIVITGAASGMGLETARVLAKKGAKLSLADVQEKPLKDLETELQSSGAQVLAQVVDIRDRKAVESWIAATVEKFGKLDGAANLAGVIGKGAYTGGIESLDDDDWNFVMDVNVNGMKNCLRAQIPHLKDGAAIVNAASIVGLMGAANNIAYVASKHAVVGMTRTAAKELGKRQIRVNCICPGPIDTPMLRQATDIRGSAVDWSFLALGRTAHQTEVPPLIEFLLSRASSFMTGNAIPIDGGWLC
ncbi:3-alpha--hydroxysteroid dehydrogenase [Paraphoma chrysanthemicola]|uniref:3-alpha--hydroxysteroid dehydrogenase n=1 Tax=Paraphoma chrysanthemicola TaxID=798071 RepID=A0A8K0RBI2_9PLEO|nr:3-alpha--hydroxysteroid dehydrogenase [Paraphoma chrysanthemicola]